jgi:4-cresol dehydrogenase (hydroxylating)
MDNKNYRLAVKKWKTIATISILPSKQAIYKYGFNTLAAKRKILGALIPQSRDDIKHIILVANHYQIALYPFSTGHNWGYGGSTPVKDNCVIVDLSQLNRIIAFDETLGLVTVEPGVTQKQLNDYLSEHDFPFMVPVTGGGPNCSLLGNALERGYGFNPYVDHFASLTAIEALLPNGSLYQKAFSEVGCLTIDRAYKWGIGPYLDGLFSQGNIGIVTAATIALAPLPSYTCKITCDMHSDEQLIANITHLQELLKSVGAQMGPLKITNLHQLTAIEEFFPNGNPKDLLLINPQINKKLKSERIPEWVLTGTIYGDKELVTAIIKVIKQKLKQPINFLTHATLKQLKLLQKLFPQNANLKFVNYLNDCFDLDLGHPSEVALLLPYLKSGNLPDHAALNPDQNGCGLIWFTPLIPMKAKDVANYLVTIKKILIEHHMEPLVTFTSLSNYCFDSTIPILFNPKDKKAVANARACYQHLFNACKEQGFLPYRLPIDYMEMIVDKNSPHWQLAQTIKNAIDPNHIIAPGRYSS